LAETAEKEPEAETLSNETQLDQQPVMLNRRSSRMLALVVCSLTLTVIGAVTIYPMPGFNIAVPSFNSFAEVLSGQTASAPVAGPDVSATLRDIQSDQERNAAVLQENAAALQQNTAMLQHGAAALESLRQGFTAQQTHLKAVSNQLSSLMVRLDSLQNASMPLTTSSVPQPNRAGLVRSSRKKNSRPPHQPVGPVSVGGGPLNSTPGAG
jgi:hypothetical protein